jgi:hypothetical protein
MILPLLAAVAQFGVINLLHNSIAEVVWISVVVAALLFGLLSVYFLTVVYSKKNEKNKS